MIERYTLFEINEVEPWHTARDAEFIVCYIKSGRDALRIFSTKYPLPIPRVGDYVHNANALLGQVHLVEHNVYIYQHVLMHETTAYLNEAEEE